MKFQFKTSATMKPYNNKKWWIDSGIIREITIEAESIQNAFEQYQETVHDKYYVDISKNALKTKTAMYKDGANGEPQQCGYVITAKTDFDNEHREWVTQYIDLWVAVSVVLNPFERVTE